MNTRQAIYDRLANDAELVALLEAGGGADAIHYRVAPQDATYPAVIFFQQAGTPEYTFGDHHDDELWTVKAVDRRESPLRAEGINERLRAVLQDAPLDIEGQATLWFRREQDVDYGEGEPGAIVHHIGASYRLLKQPIPA